MKLLFLSVLFAIPLQMMGQGKINELRTDGVYVYDNGIRVYTPAAGGIVDSLNILYRYNKENKLYQLYPQSCISTGAIGAGINENSMVVVMMFSKTGKTLEYLTACRDEKTWENIKKLYRQFQANADKPIAGTFGSTNYKND